MKLHPQWLWERAGCKDLLQKVTTGRSTISSGSPVTDTFWLLQEPPVDVHQCNFSPTCLPSSWQHIAYIYLICILIGAYETLFHKTIGFVAFLFPLSVYLHVSNPVTHSSLTRHHQQKLRVVANSVDELNKLKKSLNWSDGKDPSWKNVFSGLFSATPNLPWEENLQQ